MIFINFYFIGLGASIGESLVISVEIKYRNHVKKENEWKDLTLSLVLYLICIDRHLFMEGHNSYIPSNKCDPCEGL